MRNFLSPDSIFDDVRNKGCSNATSTSKLIRRDFFKAKCLGKVLTCLPFLKLPSPSQSRRLQNRSDGLLNQFTTRFMLSGVEKSRRIAFHHFFTVRGATGQYLFMSLSGSNLSLRAKIKFWAGLRPQQPQQLHPQSKFSEKRGGEKQTRKRLCWRGEVKHERRDSTRPTPGEF